MAGMWAVRDTPDGARVMSRVTGIPWEMSGR